MSDKFNEKFMNFDENPVRAFLQKRMKDFVFRKIASIDHNAEYFYQASKYTPVIDGSEHCEVIGNKPHCFKNINKDDMEKSIELRFTFFAGSTTATKTRNDPFNDTIYFNSNDFCTVDPNSMFLTKISPQTSYVLPRIGDIVCGIVIEAGVDRSGKTILKKALKHKYKYIKWFICSEQFLRAWTLIMYDKHEVLDKYAKSEDTLRKRMFSGNKLTTNSFKKWTMLRNIQRESFTKKRLQSNSLGSSANPSNEIDDENNEKLINLIYEELSGGDAELNSKYFRLRYEQFSIDYIHILCAVVLVGRYGIFPDSTNIPINSNFNDQLKYWDLPKDYIKTLLENSSTTMSKVVPLRYPLDAPKRTRHDINNEEFVQQLKNIETVNLDSIPIHKEEDDDYTTTSTTSTSTSTSTTCVDNSIPSYKDAVKQNIVLNKDEKEEKKDEIKPAPKAISKGDNENLKIVQLKRKKSENQSTTNSGSATEKKEKPKNISIKPKSETFAAEVHTISAANTSTIYTSTTSTNVESSIHENKSRCIEQSGNKSESKPDMGYKSTLIFNQDNQEILIIKGSQEIPHNEAIEVKSKNVSTQTLNQEVKEQSLVTLSSKSESNIEIIKSVNDDGVIEIIIRIKPIIKNK
jgi:hypothetical protein